MKPQPHDPIRARRVPTLGGLLIAAALFAFPGLALHLYRDGLWEFVQSWRFRGAKGG